MFEKITLRRSENGPPLTVGEIAEALLFYQRIHLVLDCGSLEDLIVKIGMRQLLDLIARPEVSAVYCEDTLGTQTQRHGTVETYSFVGFSICGHKDIGHIKSKQQIMHYLLSRQGHDNKRARKFAELFLKNVPVRKLTDDNFLPGGIIRAATTDLDDSNFVHEAIRLVLIDSTDQMPGNFEFNIIREADEFQIYTDINFTSLNQARRNKDTSLGEISPAHLINEILLARADLALAGYYGSEFSTSSLTSKIIRLRHDELLRRAGINQKEISELQEIVLPNFPSVREIINSGTRTFDEFLRLLDDSDRFKGWVKGVNPDEKLVTAYFNEVRAKGWIERLPSKSIRYVLGAAVGAFAPFTGLVMSAADSFLLDKVVAGWRPNHFIDNKLAPFLSDEK